MDYNSKNFDDTNSIRALTHLKCCSTAVDDLRYYIRTMLDDVTMAFGEKNRDDAVLEAWNNGHVRVQQQQMFIQELIDEAQDFMDTLAFEELDGSKKTDYWDTLTKTLHIKVHLDAEYVFFQLLSTIEHTEQTIRMLSQRLRLHCNTLLSRQLNGTLQNRGLSIHQQRIQELRMRILRETNLLLWLIEQAAKNPHFSEMQAQKQEEYYESWKNYATSRKDIDRD